MAEVITETILPGTYIEVRAEGLLTVGAIATGNIGVIGTAEKGTAEVQTLTSFDEARARFGEIGDWSAGADGDNLSLVRTLKLLFDNGATTVYARRVLAESDDAAKGISAAKTGTYAVSNASNAPILKLRAKTPGDWGNRLQIRIEAADSDELVSDELLTGSGTSLALSAEKVAEPISPAGTNGVPEPSLGNIVVRENGLANRYQIKKSAPSAESVQLNPATRVLTFAVPPSASAEVRATYRVPQASLRKVTLRYGNIQEVYVVPSASYLAQLLADSPSKLAEVEQRTGDGLPNPTARFEAFAGGSNGSPATEHFQTALDALVEQDIQILIVGRKFSDLKGSILGHLERTENLGRERIAFVGADSIEVEKILENANDVADKRLVLIAPGLSEKDPDTGKASKLPTYCAAAAVAGKVSSLSPHVSLTNKTLAGIEGLSAEYNYGDLKALVQNRVLTLQRKRGIRVVKAVTTDDEAFKQITLRRIVDYVKQGTRLGANQYIGKLNNRRVRENLRTTLDGFLADLLTREFLTGYKLTVFADRAMEIRGEVQVVMDLNPTFSIDVIRVVMNLS